MKAIKRICLLLLVCLAGSILGSRLTWLFAEERPPASVGTQIGAHESDSHSSNAIRVASINLCADQLVLLLAKPENILSLSNLSHDEAGSWFYEQARNFPTNRGDAETVLRLAPDVVIAGEYTTQHSVALLRELGVRVETLPLAHSIEQMLNNITEVSGWLGVPGQGRKVVTAMRKRLASLDAETALQTEPKPGIAVFDANGYTAGAESLRGRLITRAGWRNIASDLGVRSYGKLALESLIHNRPDALFNSPYSPGSYSRAQALTRHPAITGAGLEPVIVTIPSRMTVCSGPWTLDVIEQLQQVRQQFDKGS